jgi:hypothetical protein
MDVSVVAVTEHLAEEFPDRPTRRVALVVADCAADCPDSDPMFVEQAAARARLTAREEPDD